MLCLVSDWRYTECCSLGYWFSSSRMSPWPVLVDITYVVLLREVDGTDSDCVLAWVLAVRTTMAVELSMPDFLYCYILICLMNS